MKKGWQYILLVIGLCAVVIPFVWGASVSCSIKSSCGVYETDFGGISNLTNGHYEQYNESVYTHRICCSYASITLSNDCSGIFTSTNKFIRASNFTNAHVELNNESTSSYIFQCISTTAGALSLTYALDNGTCASASTCMFTVSNNTNAHVAACNDTESYTTSVCLTSASVPEFGTLGMIAALSILGVGFIFGRKRRQQHGA